MIAESPSAQTQRLDYGLQYRIWHSESESYVAVQVARCESLFADLMPEDTSLPALDIGCGMGFALRWLEQRGYREAEGIDIDESQIAACRRLGVKATLVGQVADFLDSRPGKYGLVLMCDVLEHIPEDERLDVLRLVNQTLLPNGRVILTVPNASSIVATRWRYLDYTHCTTFTEVSLRFVLDNAGFADIEISSSDPAPSLRSVLVPWRLLPSLFHRGRRKQLALAITRWLWRNALYAELHEDVSKIPLGRNLHAVAVKPSSAPQE